jgi:predicted Zn-dependent peptidase
MGVRWETAANSGISNFVHAVMVKGTTRHSGGEIAETIASLGGKLSANGDVDYSEIRGTALARFWRELLGLAAELALEPALKETEVETEREFIMERIQRRRDNPSSRAFSTFFAKLYGAHPYGLPNLGTRESIARIDHPAIVAWYRTYYRPERMVLAVSGQAPAAEVVAEAKRLFGNPADVEKPPPDPTLPSPPSRGGRTVVEQPAQQAQILAGGLAPRVEDRDYAAAKVLSAVLGGGLAGRLFAELRDKQGLAYTANAYYDPLREPSSILLYLGTAPANAKRAEQALGKQLVRIRKEPVGAEELRRAKAFLLGSMAIDRRTNAREAWYLAFYETVGVGHDFPARYKTAVQDVSAADVLRVAKSSLDQLTTVVLVPSRKR